jgi:hypothetical protein
LYRRLGGPQGRSGQVRKTSPPPGFDPRTIQPVASPIPTELPDPVKYIYIIPYITSEKEQLFSSKRTDLTGYLVPYTTRSFAVVAVVLNIKIKSRAALFISNLFISLLYK